MGAAVDTVLFSPNLSLILPSFDLTSRMMYLHSTHGLISSA
jgi:hypothetical protein